MGQKLSNTLEAITNSNAPLTLLRAAHLKYQRWHENGGQGTRHAKEVAERLARLIRMIEANQI